MTKEKSLRKNFAPVGIEPATSDHQSDAHPSEPPRPAYSNPKCRGIVKKEYLVINIGYFSPVFHKKTHML